MRKEYQKPDAEFVSLVAKETITSVDWLDGEMGLESSEF